LGIITFGITLSEKQLCIDRELIAAEGLEKLCHITYCDYRAIECRYDRIISVGMFEHVGRRNWPKFFPAVANVLALDGVFVLHTICRNRRAPRDPFVLKHVFPGFDLPTFVDVIHQADHAGFRLWHVENLQSHYAQTLLCWLANLKTNRERIIRAHGEYSYRLFEVFLAGGAASFSSRDGMQLGQFVFTTQRHTWTCDQTAVISKLANNF
jgi:cyclopropane-fatty-acyl-phospholipid synthase